MFYSSVISENQIEGAITIMAPVVAPLISGQVTTLEV